jgi:hypothetical protein
MAASAEEGSISGAATGVGFKGAGHKKGSNAQSRLLGAADAAPATDSNTIAKDSCFRTLQSLR